MANNNTLHCVICNAYPTKKNAQNPANVSYHTISSPVSVVRLLRNKHSLIKLNKYSMVCSLHINPDNPKLLVENEFTEEIREESTLDTQQEITDKRQKEFVVSDDDVISVDGSSSISNDCEETEFDVDIKYYCSEDEGESRTTESNNIDSESKSGDDEDLDLSPVHQIKIYNSVNDFSADDMQCEVKAKKFFDITTKEVMDLRSRIRKNKKRNNYLLNKPKEVYRGPVCIFCEHLR